MRCEPDLRREESDALLSGGPSKPYSSSEVQSPTHCLSPSVHFKLAIISKYLKCGKKIGKKQELPHKISDPSFRVPLNTSE